MHLSTFLPVVLLAYGTCASPTLTSGNSTNNIVGGKNITTSLEQAKVEQPSNGTTNAQPSSVVKDPPTRVVTGDEYREAFLQLNKLTKREKPPPWFHDDRYYAPNDYKTTPTPGVYICTKFNFSGDCIWLPVVQDPRICQRLNDKYAKYISMGIDRDLQCALHSSPNCDGGHGDGRWTWPGIPGLSPDTYPMGGDFKAYKCRRCPNCSEYNHSDWDGNSDADPPGSDAPTYFGP